MEIVLNIPAEKIEGSLDDIMNSLTDEQKVEIAKQAFDKLIEKEFKIKMSDWRNSKVQSLFNNFENHFSNVMKESPAISCAITAVTDDLVAELPKLAEKAMTAVLANMLAAQFGQIAMNQQDTFNTNMRINNIVNKLQMRE